MKSLFFVAALSVTSSAFASEKIVHATNASGDCPTSQIKVVLEGESYAEGVKYTADVKGLLVGKLKIVSSSETEVTMEGKLPGDADSCTSDFGPVSMFNDLNSFKISIRDSKLVLKVKTESLRIDSSSNFNNQMIFKVSEIL